MAPYSFTLDKAHKYCDGFFEVTKETVELVGLNDHFDAELDVPECVGYFTILMNKLIPDSLKKQLLKLGSQPTNQNCYS
jgi:membrane-bound lytic murein transglycosylase MltF